jgi:chemotaxis protein CheC
MSQSTPPIDAGVLDALTELVSIGVGRAAASLSDLVGERIELTLPQVQLFRDGSATGIDPVEPTPSTVVMQDFHGRISGRAALAFPQASALTLGNLLSGDEVVTVEFDAELNGILLEVGNIVLNGVLGSLSNLVGDNFDYSLPILFDDHGKLSRLFSIQDDVPDVLIANVEFRVQNREIRGTVAIVFAGGCVTRLLLQLLEPAA